uniref:FSH-beta subunit n=2 Tax=Solea senegalensis TaxID=28829 RepID=B2KS56_SOLSE|nr:gonadotropin subunit beta-1-like isoform X2 [Solea senegalensis]ABU95601.1 FSH-beta subunit precursor [Solea senegalensis]ABW81403.1 follicle stimulating hormone beta subunit [Solea senegalensis]
MQLVVMAAVLAIAGAGQSCSSRCRPANVSIPVQSCGNTEYIYTTMCAGQCYHEDPNYIHELGMDRQVICNGDWTYEVKRINGCPQAVTYPVATNCHCTSCNPDNTHCGRFPGEIASCLSF